MFRILAEGRGKGSVDMRLVSFQVRDYQSIGLIHNRRKPGVYQGDVGTFIDV